MTKLNKEAEWESRYKSGQTGWDRGAASPSLTSLLDNKSCKPCRLLVPGCGRGYEVALLAEQGFDVTAIDIAPSAVRAARGLLAQHGLIASIVQTNFMEWIADEPFDAIYEQTSLCALSPDNWTAYERKLWGWLKPGGKLFAHFLQTDQPGGPPFHCDMSEMKTLFNTSKWEWPDEVPRKIEHPSGKHEFSCTLVRRQTQRRTRH
jgi:methyl halide transferase